MSQLTPPLLPPFSSISDSDGRERLQFRIWQVLLATLTVMVAIWVSSFGYASAILAWVIAKHILVAILMVGLHRYPTYKDEVEPPPPNL